MEEAGSGSNKVRRRTQGPRIRLPQTSAHVCGWKMFHITLVIIICLLKFGFSDKSPVEQLKFPTVESGKTFLSNLRCVWIIKSVEKLCKSPPVSSETFTTLSQKGCISFFLLSNKRCWNPEVLSASLTIMPITLNLAGNSCGCWWGLVFARVVFSDCLIFCRFGSTVRISSVSGVDSS